MAVDFFDSRNVQKSVTQIIYLGPLPRDEILSGMYELCFCRAPALEDGVGLEFDYECSKEAAHYA